LTRGECLLKLFTVLGILVSKRSLVYGGEVEKEKETAAVQSLDKMWLIKVKWMLGHKQSWFSSTSENSLLWKGDRELGKPVRRDTSNRYSADVNLLRWV